MSRWKSPDVAVKRAQRADKKAEKSRRENRRGRLMLIGLVLYLIGFTVADYFWLKARAARRREEHQRIFHGQARTNSPASQGGGGKTNSGVAP